MFFSILIPVYNVERYLRDCVDSVISQEETDYEILLVDDGSTDSSGQICNEYANKYPDVIRVIHKKNEGLLLTRRRAIQEAKGDWLVHLDSDDYMLPGFLNKLRQTIELTGADLVIYKIVYGKEDLNDFSVVSQLPFADQQQFCEEDKSILYRQLLAGGYMTAIHQKAARRDIVDIDRDYHIFNGVSIMEDHLQSLPLLDCSQKTVFMDTPALYYRHNCDSITKKKGYASYKAAFMSIYRVYQEEVLYHEKWRLSDDVIADISVKHLRTLCGYIEMMAQTVGTAEHRKDFAEFITWLSCEQLWKDDWRKKGKKEVGKVCSLCIKLVNGRKNAFLRFLYRRVVPLMSGRK